MRRAQPLAALGAGLLCLAMGVHDACRQPGAAEREPAFAKVLLPLAAMPLPAGSAVALVVPPEIVAAGTDRQPLFFEAVWRRPDLLWSFPPDARHGITCRYVVLVGPAQVSPPWRQVWRGGYLALFERPPA